MNINFDSFRIGGKDKDKEKEDGDSSSSSGAAAGSGSGAAGTTQFSAAAMSSAFDNMSRNILSKKIFSSDDASPGAASQQSSSGTAASSNSSSGSSFTETSSFQSMFSSKKKDDTSSRIAHVMSLLEDFRLQCPQTHAGLVVAFTATTLSPLTEADVKFKWYRMDKAKDQFLAIDEGRRAWYPPTADDIGKNICAQCEDIFEQGYCRYAEAGPVEADPMLRSLVDSALQNDSYGVKDVSVSLGTALAVDPTQPSDGNNSASARAIDMHIKNRPSALHTSPEVIGSHGFTQFEKRCPVEVDRNGVYIAAFDTGPNFASGVNRKGLLIKGSAAIKVQCTLPASLVISVPISIDAGERGSDIAAEEGRGRTGSSSMDSSSLSASGKAHGIDDASDICEWLGDRSGGNFQQLDIFFRKLYGSGVSSINELHICIACGDRIQRDALALTIRTIASMGPSASLRERMETLPWYSTDGSASSNSSVQSTASNEMGARLKDLEAEMKALRQQRDELTLRLLEASSGSSVGPDRSTSSDGARATNTDAEESGSAVVSRSKSNEEVGEVSMRDLAKMQALETELQALRDNELHLEKKSIETQNKLKRLTEEKDLHSNHAKELQASLSDVTRELAESKVECGKLKSSLAEVQSRLKDASKVHDESEKISTAVRDLENTIVSIRNELAESEAACAAQKAETRIIAKELHDAQQLNAGMQAKLASSEANQQVLQSQIDELTARLAAAEAERDAAKAENENLLAENTKFDDLEESLEDALEKVEKLEGLLDQSQSQKLNLQHKCDSLSKDVKRLLKQIEDVQTSTSKQLKEASIALERRNEEFRGLQESLAQTAAESSSSGTSGGSGIGPGSLGPKLPSFFRKP